MNFSITNRCSMSSPFSKTPSEKLFNHVADWRIVSSGVVKRSYNRATEGRIESSSVYPKESITSENDFLQHSYLTESLRKPIRYHKVKKNLEEDNDESRMTRNCENLFSQMKSSFSLPKTKNDADPSLSVRRIVKGSGLLAAFGPGLLPNDDNKNQNLYHQEIHNDRPTNLEFHSKEPFDVEAFINAVGHSTQIRATDLWQSNSSVNEEAKSDYGFEIENSPNRPSNPLTTYNHHSSSLPFMYDTVLMQKTIETELVEYLPYEDEDASPPQKRHITGKKTVIYTPASNNLASMKKVTKLEKSHKCKDQFSIEARYEELADLSEGSKTCSSEF